MPVAEQSMSMLGKIAEYVEALSRDPQSTVFVPLAETYRQMGLLDDALEVVQKGLETLPRLGVGYVCLGRIQAQRGALREAEAGFSKALELEPKNVSALKGLARVSTMSGQKERARQLLEDALRLRPDDASMAEMLASLGPAAVPSPATASQKPAGMSSPETGTETGDREEDQGQSPIATATIAEIYVKQGLVDKALKIYDDLLKANPDNPALQLRHQEITRLCQGEVPTAAPAASTVCEPEGVAAPDNGALSLAALEAWLDAIRDRRMHVR